MAPSGCTKNFMSSNYKKQRKKRKRKVTPVVKGGTKSKLFPLL